MKFANRLKYYMGRAGVTGRALAEKSGVSESAVSRYMTGMMPRPNVMTALAAALGVSVGELRGDGEAIGGDGAEEHDLRKVPVDRAARAIGMGAHQLRYALEMGVTPFGFAIPPRPGCTKWEYNISPKQLREYTDNF